MSNRAKNEDWKLGLLKRPVGIHSRRCDELKSHLPTIGFDDLGTLLGTTSTLDEINQLPLATDLERPPKSVKDRLMNRIRGGSVTAA